MKVILRKDIVNVGKEGGVIEVSEGYARNYLFPRKLAVPAGDAQLKELEKSKKRLEKKEIEKKEELKRTAEKLESIAIEIKADAGESGKLFGSVTATDICDAIKNSSGIEIDKKKIIIEEPIRTLGDHFISAKLHADIETKVRISVITSK
jgi:large subunit ribosomal protein L9